VAGVLLAVTLLGVTVSGRELAIVAVVFVVVAAVAFFLWTRRRR
jgi:hypothetical protein